MAVNAIVLEMWVPVVFTYPDFFGLEYIEWVLRITQKQETDEMDRRNTVD